MARLDSQTVNTRKARLAGYSSAPLIKKLGIKPDSKIIFINEPVSLYRELGELPENIKTAKSLDQQFDYIHYFTTFRTDLESFFKLILKFLKKDGMLWVSWPKKSSKVTTDLDENIIREIGLKNGLVDVKVAAIDEVWSGLKFVRRLKDR